MRWNARIAGLSVASALLVLPLAAQAGSARTYDAPPLDAASATTTPVPEDPADGQVVTIFVPSEPPKAQPKAKPKPPPPVTASPQPAAPAPPPPAPAPPPPSAPVVAARVPDAATARPRSRGGRSTGWPYRPRRAAE